MESHTHESEGARLNLTCWLLVGLSATFMSLRLYCKWLRRRKLWWDDYVLISAWIMLAVSIAVTSLNVSVGLGLHFKEIPAENLESFLLYSTIASVPNILAAAWSKTSFIITLARLMMDRWQRILLWTIGIVLNVPMTVLAVATFLRCNPPEKNWKPMIEGTCWPPEAYTKFGIFAGAYSAAADIVLALLPWPMLWNMRLNMKEKLGVGIAMSMGIFAGATAIVKTVHLPLLGNGDFSYEGATLVIWATAESAVTIMAASVPMLRVLVRDIVPLTTNRLRRTSMSGSSSRGTKPTGGSGVTIGTAKGSRPARHYASGKSGIGAGTVGNSTVIMAGVDEDLEDGLEMEEGPRRHVTPGPGTAKRTTRENTTSVPDAIGESSVGGDHDESPAASVSDERRWANSETSILGPEADYDNQQHGHQRIVAAPAADVRNKAAGGSPGGILATRELDVAYANADRLEAQNGGGKGRGAADGESSEVRPEETGTDGKKRKKSRVLGRFGF